MLDPEELADAIDGLGGLHLFEANEPGGAVRGGFKKQMVETLIAAIDLGESGELSREASSADVVTADPPPKPRRRRWESRSAGARELHPKSDAGGGSVARRLRVRDCVMTAMIVVGSDG